MPQAPTSRLNEIKLSNYMHHTNVEMLELRQNLRD